MRPSLLRAAVAAVLGVVATSAHAGINYITNGGFESGDFTGWATTLASSGSDLSVSSPGYTGEFSAAFAADATEYDSISQLITVIPGQRYALSYWIQNLGQDGDSLQVFVEGAALLTETPVSAPLDEWQMRSFEFQATIPSAQVRFSGYDDKAHFLIDDITVIILPTPGATALLSLGIICVVIVRRR